MSGSALRSKPPFGPMNTMVTGVTTYLKRLFAAKLGRCALCMRAALHGAAGVWLLVLIAVLAGMHLLLTSVLASVATALTGLTLAHVVAYVWRATPITPGTSCCAKHRVLQPQQFRQLQRRSMLRAASSLPAAFGLTYMAWAPRLARAQTKQNVETGVKEYRTELTCDAKGAACTGKCIFGAVVRYDFVPLADNKKKITRFYIEWFVDQEGSCDPSVDRGFGDFDFKCVGDSKECKVTGGNIWDCPCGSKVFFVDLNETDDNNCICPDRVAVAHGRCGAPFAFEKECPEGFEFIDLDFIHKVTCGCPDAPSGHLTRGNLDIVFQYYNGEISFDRSIAPKK